LVAQSPSHTLGSECNRLFMSAIILLVKKYENWFYCDPLPRV
jgi:hypothetical protein